MITSIRLVSPDIVMYRHNTLGIVLRGSRTIQTGLICLVLETDTVVTSAGWALNEDWIETYMSQLKRLRGSMR